MHTHPETLVDQWQVEKHNWIGASWNSGVALKRAATVAECCGAPCGFLTPAHDGQNIRNQLYSFYQGCLEIFLLCPMFFFFFLTLINRTLVHYCMIGYSLSEYTRIPPDCNRASDFSPLGKTSAGKLCIAGVPGRKCSESWVTQPHQARECSSLSGLASFVFWFVCFSFSTVPPPPPIITHLSLDGKWSSHLPWNVALASIWYAYNLAAPKCSSVEWLTRQLIGDGSNHKFPPHSLPLSKAIFPRLDGFCFLRLCIFFS